jgi:hypothetical protein
MWRAEANRGLQRMGLCMLVLAPLALLPSAAAAYSCMLSPGRDSVIIKTDNPSPGWKMCTVACTFAVPEGYATITCWQSVPGGARAWEVCVRPTNGKAFGALASGHEHCVARAPDKGN